MKKSLLLAAASLVVISCSKRTIEAGGGEIIPDGPKSVQFSSGMSNASTKVKDTLNHSLFVQGDIIGVYAVLHGKKLGINGIDAFPSSTAFQYLSKYYTVQNKPVFDVDKPDTSIAQFLPTNDMDKMYYQAGNVAWNYYAFYPTTSGVANATQLFSLPVATTNPGVTEAAFTKTENAATFFKQDGMQMGAYPGPILFAYSNVKDTAVPYGQVQKPVSLKFKNAVAKITMNVEVKGAVGDASRIGAILLSGTGLKQGLVFNLTKATEVNAATNVYEVITQSSVGTDMDGTYTSNSYQLPATAKGYLFGKTITLPLSNKSRKAADPNWTPGANEGKVTDDSTLFVTTGYLVPAGITGTVEGKGSLKDVNIKFFVTSVMMNQAPEILTAKLDRSAETDGKNYLSEIRPGKEYKFKIVLSKNAIGFQATIEDWEVIEEDDIIPAQ